MANDCEAKRCHNLPNRVGGLVAPMSARRSAFSGLMLPAAMFWVFVWSTPGADTGLVCSVVSLSLPGPPETRRKTDGLAPATRLATTAGLVLDLEMLL